MAINLRYLTWLNTLSCLFLVVIIGWQWKTSTHLEQKYNLTQKQLQDTKIARETAEQKNLRLQSDLDGLKQALDAMRSEAATQKEQLAKQASTQGQNQQQTNNIVQQANQQLAKWADAIKQRDETIRDLNTKLLSTRTRLDDAIRQIRTANAAKK